ncbi:unnamed protein product [Sphagnum jensenii]|uniref:Phosphotransferase n=1 Tax=Sphagnum jensenii TaxID=128206 RepID=A0ABP1B7B9_9BRYO
MMVGCVAAVSYVRVGSVLRSPAHTRSQNCKPQWTMLCMQKQENTWAQMLVRAFREASATPLPLLRQVADAMTAEMYNGLASEGGSQQLKMLPTYVENLPTGEEEGLYYAVDLGGTNFRVLRVLLGGKQGHILKQEFEEVAIPPALMLSTSRELFDFIASEVVKFMAKESDDFKPHSLDVREIGFAFSFPVLQTSVRSGVVIQWTKGFKIDDAIGKDIVAAFQESIGRLGKRIEIAALVNDTVGTLAQGRYFNTNTMIGVILGTGTNACYVEQADAVPKWKGPIPASGQMVINLEWGNFRSPYLPRTFADEEVDRDSINPGDQWFEKMISGLYLGEIVRCVLVKFATDAVLFGGSVPLKLLKPFSLPTPAISKMHSDDSPELKLVKIVLEDIFEIKNSTLEARKIVHELCGIIVERGGRLAAAGIVGILQKIGRAGSRNNGTPVPNKVTAVAIDGGLYEHYAQYQAHMHAAIVELLGENAAQSVVIELSKDGSGIGTALLAASHSQHAKRHKQAESLTN